MSRFNNETDYFHGKAECIGILLVNLGTPDAPTTKALRRYLKQFLSDSRVIEIPRFIWLPILYGFILTKRAPKSAEKYQSIWTDDGSPLLQISQQQQIKLQKELDTRFLGPIKVELGMRYGNPSIKTSLKNLQQAGARRLLILPLYPQYSATTTASIFDTVYREIMSWRWMPELRQINHYHDHPTYIQALANSIETHWRKYPRGDLLLISFHGIPKRNLSLGDPYHCECHKTARLLANHLKLKPEQWRITFQSRFGKAEWLQPYTSQTLAALPKEGIKRVDIVCPGFAADCLETLEEIQIENHEIFKKAGGESYHYIPALNDHNDHIRALADLVQQHSQGWPETTTWDHNQYQKQTELSKKRALSLGAKV